ncbi:OmpA family protein [Cellulophaga sp. F20128]|uniref:OmpA family protein n=1 Tax=Cellulophaga sp. F20128 TaxID=2926413 RepID=UPI001FF3C06F|nr:OmpA family protein [Cellulophaga sp. F20128]MCK0156725.1 OmpA family protein [Cellulophaga sp. F20128]
METDNRIEKVILAFFVISLLLIYKGIGQEAKENNTQFNISSHIGYDFPTYANNTPFINYDGGMDLGLSLDYYYHWIGIGADVDYIANSPRNTYPTTNLFNSRGIPLEDINLDYEDITRFFYGLGPNFKYTTKSKRFTAEINTRIGFAAIKGGRTSLTHSGGFPLNFHAGYNAKQILSAKGQLRFTYFFNDHLGFNLGGYYLNHFKTPELNESGITSMYAPFTEKVEQDETSSYILEDGNPVSQINPIDHSVWSVGAFVGLTYKFTKKTKLCKICGLDHKPHCIEKSTCNITITVKDKYSGEILANANVLLEDAQGNIIKTGITNLYGTVIFEDISVAKYFIKGKFYSKELDKMEVSVEDFKNCSVHGNSIQKDLVYSDQNFIMKGVVIECNDITKIEGVNILLRDKVSSLQKNTISTLEGEFTFYLNKTSIYILKGVKDGYFSNDIEVNAKNFNRKESLFIDLEMCVDPCGKAIKLTNINFELAKWNIDNNAQNSLQYIITLMKENSKIKVEMSSHTDSRGSKEFNQVLSQKRAQSTVDYIVSQGIDKDRLIARGAGETELLNYCMDFVSCTETEHAANRRTEFKIICSD